MLSRYALWRNPVQKGLKGTLEPDSNACFRNIFPNEVYFINESADQAYINKFSCKILRETK